MKERSRDSESQLNLKVQGSVFRQHGSERVEGIQATRRPYQILRSLLR